MRVVVFDIDGTLTATSKVDGELFATAVHGVLGLTTPAAWPRFVEMTDSAILAEIAALHSSRPYAELEIEVQKVFFASLQHAARVTPDAFRAVPGAVRILGVCREAGWIPVIATGGWRWSAEFKLRTAGIPLDHTALATSSEHSRRVDIVREAVRRGLGQTAATATVLVGDGLWDLAASEALGIGFVGRAVGESARVLREEGARTVVPDFKEPELFLAALTRAASGAAGR